MVDIPHFGILDIFKVLRFLLSTQDYVMSDIRRIYTKWLLKRKEIKGSQLIYYDKLKISSSFTFQICTHTPPPSMLSI